MPFLKVYSNADLKDKNAQEFVERAGELIASELNKPIEYVIVSLDYMSNMSFGGSAKEKGVWANLASVGFANKESISKLLTEFFYSRFENIELKNINIALEDLSPSSLAIGGKLLG